MRREHRGLQAKKVANRAGVNGMHSAGTVIMFGSGETAATGRTAFDWLFKRAGEAPRVAILETPAGFEPNSADVAGRWADFVSQRLHHHHPQVTVVPARKRGTEYSPNDRELIAPLLAANTILLGAGSPTYAAKQLRGTAAWDLVVARHFLGGERRAGERVGDCGRRPGAARL
jgi:hypothetical protein